MACSSEFAYLAAVAAGGNVVLTCTFTQARGRIGYYLTIISVWPELVDCSVRICENDYEWGGNFIPSLIVLNKKLLAKYCYEKQCTNLIFLT